VNNDIRETNTPNRPLVAAALLGAITLGALALTACNTTEGVGEDIQAAGRGIENTAEDAKD